MTDRCQDSSELIENDTHEPTAEECKTNFFKRNL